MKRFLCFILALLLTYSDHSKSMIKYYCAVIFQDHTCYEEMFLAPFLELIIRDFVSDPNIESETKSRMINSRKGARNISS